MTTIIRVRRKRTTDALENLVLPLKRAKVSTGTQAANAPTKAQDDNKAVFTFAGTVERKNQPISIHIQSALRRAAIGLTPKKPTKQSHQSAKSKTESNRTGAREKARASHIASSKNRRLKVIDSSRDLKLHDLDKDSLRYQSTTTQKPAVSNGSGQLRRPGSAAAGADRVFALLDVVQDEGAGQKSLAATTTTKTKVSNSKKPGSEDISCNSVKMTREKVDVVQESEYVYDLYYTDCAEFDFGENSFGMKTDKDELVYEYFADEPPHAADDEDDENDESNWRNEYPDDEDAEHRTDRDMFDELVDDYRYASSDDEDLVEQYSKCKLGSKGRKDSDSDSLDDYDL